MQPWQAQHSSNLKQNLNPILFSNLDQFYEYFSKLNLCFQFKMKPGIMKATQAYLGVSLQKFHMALVNHNLYDNDYTPLWLVHLLLAGS